MLRLVLCSFIIVAASSASIVYSQGGPYYWDLMPTPLNAAEVTALFLAAIPGETFPIFNEPPHTSFTCQGKLGYYADPQAGCQAFQRCTINGDQVTYLCPNGTLFNQLALVCDWWYNVDCAKAESYYNFANPRIYDQNAKLHDTPPPTYLAPWQKRQLAEFQSIIDVQLQQQRALPTAGSSAQLLVPASSDAVAASSQQPLFIQKRNLHTPISFSTNRVVKKSVAYKKQ